MAPAEDGPGNSFHHRLEILLETPGQEHPADLFRDVSDDFWFWLNTEGRETSATLRDMLPGLPHPAVQRRWTGKDGSATLAEGFEIYRTMRDLHASHFGPIRQNIVLLDFGCGFGRVIRYFLKDVAKDHLIGTDNNQSLIDFSRQSNRWCRFITNSANPPLPIGDNELDYVYAYSVFSHFSEPMHQRWLEEFKRVVRPGGAVALTIRPRSFIEHCRRLRRGEATGVSPISRHMFLDADSALARYDTGEFCFSPYNPDDKDASWGEASISRAYVEKQWSRLFELVEFVNAGGLKQHTVLLRA